MATNAPINWSAPIVKLYLAELLERSRNEPNRWHGVGDPMRIQVAYRPDKLFPPTGTYGCWEISSFAPAGHSTTYFRQSTADSLDQIFSTLGDEIHYGPHSAAEVYSFMERVKLLTPHRSVGGAAGSRDRAPRNPSQVAPRPLRVRPLALKLSCLGAVAAFIGFLASENGTDASSNAAKSIAEGRPVFIIAMISIIASTIALIQIFRDRRQNKGIVLAVFVFLFSLNALGWSLPGVFPGAH